jgi:hypothetical protein
VDEYQMRPRIGGITLGVDDLKTSLSFYRNTLGLQTEGTKGTEFEHGAVLPFDIQNERQAWIVAHQYLARDAGARLQLINVTAITKRHFYLERQRQ